MQCNGLGRQRLIYYVIHYFPINQVAPQQIRYKNLVFVIRRTA